MAVRYLNNKNEWPEGLWEEWGDPPSDERRCQYRGLLSSKPCGLPHHAEDEGGNPRCMFHYEGEREAWELGSELEAAVARGALLWEAKLQNTDLQGINLQDAALGRAALQNANLFGATLQNANLQGAELQDAILSGTGLQDAELRWANLRGAALIWTVLQKANLERAELQNAELVGAELQHANLYEAVLQDAELSEAELQDAILIGANLQDAILRDAKLQDADLRWARLTGEVDLRGADLTNARLEGLELSPQAKLDGVIWGLDQEGRLRCERDAVAGDHRRYYSQPWAFRECEAVYRQIKLSYQESGDYQTAGQFFIREMECQRRRLILEAREGKQKRGRLGRLCEPVARWLGGTFERPFRWLGRAFRRPLCGLRKVSEWIWDLRLRTFDRAFRWVMCATCRYGEDPKRLLAIMLLLVLVFAFVHMLAGFDRVVDGEREAVWHGWFEPNPDLPLKWALWKAVYFSVLNFTSLGHGDYQPSDAGTVVCVAEVFLGVTLIALFMVCVARRFSR